MGFFKIISKKIIITFIIIGIAYSFAYVYLSIPIAQWFNTTEYVWNRRIWKIVAFLLVAIRSLLPIKTISLKSVIVRCILGIIILILVSNFMWFVMLFASPGGFGD